jgi:sugar lactone lactonase YvrE
MQGAPDGIAIDPLPNEQFVYWTAFDDGTVMKIPLAGGTPFQMATNQNNPTAIAVDTDNVYWASEGNGAIVKVAK